MAVFVNDLETRDQASLVVCQDSQGNWGDLELQASLY